MNEDHTELPMNGLTLSWHGLTVWVRKKSDEDSSWLSTKYYQQKVLKKVSGIAEPGRLLAIMGPSGAGKTTLLATMSHRLKGDVKGKIKINGKEVSRELMMRVSGFVPQHDLTYDSLTVLEHMHIMAKLKMDRRVSSVQRTQRILALISELGITRCTHSKISELSGGEKKRLSLAVQMIIDPGILFCDEPTTGMDSYSAASVVEQLRQLSGRGKTVICTIHQPASGIFDMFHSVYLLVSGGRLALYGPTSQVAPYFASIGMECPPTYNLAEFIVSQLAITDDEESVIKVNQFCSQFKSSPLYEKLLCKLEAQIDYDDPFIDTSSSIDSVYQPGNEFQKYLSVQQPYKITQLKWLIWRSVKDIVRKPQDQFLRLCFYLFLAVLISTPYLDLKIDQEGIQNLQGLLYLVVVETIFTFNYSVVHTFPAEIPILLREVNDGLYSPGAYYISKMIILLPRAIIEPILYSGIIFFIAGLFGGFGGFLNFCIPVIACSIVATAHGCVISAVFESIAFGSLASVPFEQITLMFCGIYLSLSDVPLHFIWVKYISVFYYALEAVSIAQWDQIKTIPCTRKSGAPCISTGEGVLNNYGYKSSNLAIDLGGLFGLYCLYHLIGFIAFWRRSKKRAAY